MDKNKTNKLFKVTIRGMHYNTTGPVRGTSYVIAATADEAYAKVRKYLDEKDYGYSHDRQLKNIELMAEEYDYTDVGILTFHLIFYIVNSCFMRRLMSIFINSLSVVLWLAVYHMNAAPDLICGIFLGVNGYILFEYALDSILKQLQDS